MSNLKSDRVEDMARVRVELKLPGEKHTTWLSPTACEIVADAWFILLRWAERDHVKLSDVESVHVKFAALDGTGRYVWGGSATCKAERKKVEVENVGKREVIDVGSSPFSVRPADIDGMDEASAKVQLKTVLIQAEAYTKVELAKVERQAAKDMQAFCMSWMREERSHSRELSRINRDLLDKHTELRVRVAEDSQSSPWADVVTRVGEPLVKAITGALEARNVDARVARQYVTDLSQNHELVEVLKGLPVEVRAGAIEALAKTMPNDDAEAAK